VKEIRAIFSVVLNSITNLLIDAYAKNEYEKDISFFEILSICIKLGEIIRFSVRSLELISRLPVSLSLELTRRTGVPNTAASDNEML